MNSPRRMKRKTIAILAAVLVMGIAASCLLIGKMRERKPFADKVVAGYRFHCTLSPDWQLKPNPAHSSPGTVEEYTFSASLSPVREWIALHLFHQPPAKGISFGGRPQLIMGTETGKAMPSLTFQAGYPELDLHAPPMAGIKVVPGRHFRIDNCPATVTGIDLGTVSTTGHYTLLLVSTPDHVNTYFVTTGAELRYSYEGDREIQAILSSIHVEKVAAASSDRR
jgi:hypothetical protein